MALTGGVILNPRNGQRISWKPVGPVVDAWNFIAGHRANGFTCLGVLGNRAHLLKSGDHTPYSTHTAPGGIRPKAGWVYAIDVNFGKLSEFERWLLAALRAGKYKEVKYWNILNRHWNRSSGFKYAVYSGDHHLHLSFMPGYETSRSSLLIDFFNEVYLGKKPTVPSIPKPVPGNYVTYKVAKGDNLTEISKKFGVPVQTLVSLNGLSNPNSLNIGQVLKIKLIPAPVPQKPATHVTYKVVKGDNLTAIAEMHDTTVDTLVKLNGLKNPNDLAVGQVLKVKAVNVSKPARAPRPAVISGVKRKFDPNKIGPYKITKGDKVIFNDITAASAGALRGYFRFVPGFGGNDNEQERKLVQYLVNLIGSSSIATVNRLGVLLNGSPAQRTYELTPGSIAVFREITIQAGGRWNPKDPLDTMRAFGHTDGWWT